MEPKVRAPLSEQGFDVLTDIDVAPTLRAKLGVERAPYPTFAQRALELGPSVVLLPPCNVVLETVDAGTCVAIVDRARSCTPEVRGARRRSRQLTPGCPRNSGPRMNGMK